MFSRNGKELKNINKIKDTERMELETKTICCEVGGGCYYVVISPLLCCEFPSACFWFD